MYSTYVFCLCILITTEVDIPYSLENTPPSNISPLQLEQVFTISMNIYLYSIISPSLVLKPESYCKRGGGGGGVFSSEYGTSLIQYIFNRFVDI